VSAISDTSAASVRSGRASGADIGFGGLRRSCDIRRCSASPRIAPVRLGHVARPVSKGCLTSRLMYSYLDLMRNRVREQRAQRGLSQAEVAAALGVSRQTVISIESGRYLPSLPLAFRIARFFDLPVDKMFDLEEE
jgi:putative transcriptional regulator